MLFGLLEACRSFLQNTTMWMRGSKISCLCQNLPIFARGVFVCLGLIFLQLLLTSLPMLIWCNFNFRRFSYEITPYWIWYSLEPDGAFPANSCYQLLWSSTEPTCNWWVGKQRGTLGPQTQGENHSKYGEKSPMGLVALRFAGGSTWSWEVEEHRS